MKKASQTKGIVDGFSTHEIAARRCGVADGIEEVDHAKNSVESLWYFLRLGRSEGNSRYSNLFLCSCQARRHRRLGDQKTSRDVGRRHASDQAKRERHLSLAR